MAAKKTTKKAQKKTEDKVETFVSKTTSAARKGALAYVGLFGAAYDLAQARAKKANANAQEFFGTLVERGEKLESEAGETLKETQAKLKTSYEYGSEKVKSYLPKKAANRVTELETEIEQLNAKIAELSKKKAA